MSMGVSASPVNSQVEFRRLAFGTRPRFRWGRTSMCRAWIGRRACSQATASRRDAYFCICKPCAKNKAAQSSALSGRECTARA